MDWVWDDGVPHRVHLENDANGFMPNAAAAAELASEPDFPFLARDVWAHFLALHKRRKYNENGPMRWGWDDLGWYVNVASARLGPWQLRALFALEDAFFLVRAENKK